jgi:hypothetical protein
VRRRRTGKGGSEDDLPPGLEGKLLDRGFELLTGYVECRVAAVACECRGGDEGQGKE